MSPGRPELQTQGQGGSGTWVGWGWGAPGHWVGRRKVCYSQPPPLGLCLPTIPDMPTRLPFLPSPAELLKSQGLAALGVSGCGPLLVA